MKKTDYKKELKHLYSPSSKEISVVEVPAMNFLTIDGKGDPNTSQEYREAVEALYAAAYAVKFSVKKGRLKTDFRVMPLEGLWWVPDMKTFTIDKKDEWMWRMMIMQPPVVTESIVGHIMASVLKKKNPPAPGKVRFESFGEGRSVQTLYTGPYRDEGPAIRRLHEYIEESGHTPIGKHHEIYLNDPRKSAPAKLKTIIRQPMS